MNWLKRITNKKKENIIFLHLPKAGGTTLRHVFYDQYKYLKKGELYTINRTKETPDFLNLPQKEKDKIKVLVGHFPFGLHEHLRGDFKYVTMLRDPKARVISAYNYSRSIKNHELHHLSISNTLEDFILKCGLGWLENGQTKFIAGVDNFNEKCTEKIYDKAINNLENRFIAVGILEYFDKSIRLFEKKLKWGTPRYKVRNASNSIKIKLSANDLFALENINEYDQRLYDYVNARFISELNKSNPKT